LGRPQQSCIPCHNNPEMFELYYKIDSLQTDIVLCFPRFVQATECLDNSPHSRTWHRTVCSIQNLPALQRKLNFHEWSVQFCHQIIWYVEISDYEKHVDLNQASNLAAATAATGRRCPACWPLCPRNILKSTANSGLPSTTEYSI
jgi:hypothetical protein